MNLYYKENQKSKMRRINKKELENKIIEQMKRNSPMRSQKLERVLNNQEVFKEEMSRRSQRMSRLSMSVNQLSS